MSSQTVMPRVKTWMAGPSPAMTMNDGLRDVLDPRMKL